ncbi:MAG: secondary thiamine-phosphate synthase enzyme YjbQ [Planctomycetota bacterium]
METIQVETRSRTELIDISREVQGAVGRSGVDEGVAYVYCPHTTAAVTINENADPTVVRDFLMLIEKRVPHRDDYRHGEGNSDAHIKSILVGACQPILVSGGQLTLGTWQGVFFCEFDGPRRRKVHVKVIGG